MKPITAMTKTTANAAAAINTINKMNVMARFLPRILVHATPKD